MKYVVPCLLQRSRFGNDTFNHRVQVFARETTCSILGTEGSDFLVGSCFRGRGENDIIRGTIGNDQLLD
jgi:hypothetical protein